MTVSIYDLLLYAGGMAALWAVPGPVWVALTARALSGGMAGAWPLAVGVALGDLVWPLMAILGLSWVHSVYGDYLSILRWVASVIFILMGVMLVRKPAATMNADSRLTKPGLWAGFSVGWLYWYFWAVVIPIEAIAGANILRDLGLTQPTWHIGTVLMVLMT